VVIGGVRISRIPMECLKNQNEAILKPTSGDPRNETFKTNYSTFEK
jgi:hypothetical protein